MTSTPSPNSVSTPYAAVWGQQCAKGVARHKLLIPLLMALACLCLMPHAYAQRPDPAPDIERVFRSLKRVLLRLRPVFHHTQHCIVDGHLFISVLAYPCVQLIRSQLKASGIIESWATLRKTLQVQRRTTTSMRRSDGRTLRN